jgi:hypothetical protein
MNMARYSAFLGRRVEVHYRAGDILLPASGTFVADSGRSIFLEQHLTQHGQQKHFRWEIPYQYIVRLEELTEPPAAPGASEAPIPKASGHAQTAPTSADEGLGRASSAAAGSTSEDVPAIRPLRNPPKIP